MSGEGPVAANKGGVKGARWLTRCQPGKRRGGEEILGLIGFSGGCLGRHFIVLRIGSKAPDFERAAISYTPAGTDLVVGG